MPSSKLTERVARLRKALLIFHSPTDDTVGIENASHIFAAAKHPKSFVSLAGADHLLSKRSDAVYVANVLAAWAERYLDAAPTADADAAAAAPGDRHRNRRRKIPAGDRGRPASPGRRRAGRGRRPRLRARRPTTSCWRGSAPAPSMTLRLYADHKKLPLERVSVTLSHSKIHAQDCEECETKEGKIDRIERVLTLDGDAQRRAARAAASRSPTNARCTARCHSEINIRTVEKPPS